MTLTIHLPDEQQATLDAKARALGISAEEYARQVLVQDLEADARSHRHISEIILEHMSKVPPEIMAQMPTDGASEHDHYIYGWPKKNP
jgi:plasmid stability protein